MNKVICFCRVSSSVQDLTNQRNEVLKTIKKDGFSKSEVVIVEGKESAIKLDEMERKTLNELKEVVNNNPTVKDIYFYAIDRLARKVSVVLSIVDQMTAKGINLHFLNPYPMQTMRDEQEDGMGKMFLTFLSLGAEMEMKMKNERFADKRKSMREKGQLIGGSVLYGYYRDKLSGYPMIKKGEYQIVKDIFDMYLYKDMTMRQIAKKLICDNVWNVDDFKSLNCALIKVSNIIKNPAYSGRTPSIKGSKQEKTIKYPAIVDIELQDKAIEKATNRKKEKKDTKYIYYAKGIIYTEINEERHALSPIIGNCSYGINYNGKMLNININAIDTIAWKNAKNLYNIYQKYHNFIEPQNLEKKIEDNMKKIENLKPIFQIFEDREERVNSLYVRRRLNDSKYEEEFNEIAKEKEVYTNEKIKLENENTRLKNQIKSIKSIASNDVDFTNYGDEEKRDLVKEMIESIEVIKTGKFDYEIRINPNLHLFNFGFVIPSYRYNCSGGLMRLYEIFGMHEQNISNEIIKRIASAKRKK